MADNNYMQPARYFLDWFKAWPGTTFHEDIELVDLRSRGAGRGIVAKKDIAADTILFTIPRQAILSTATSALASLVPGIVQDAEVDEGENDNDDEDAAQDPWTSLILVLIYELLRGEKSPWKPYLDVLPATFDTPMFWETDEVAALQASPVIGRIGRAEADAMIRSKVLSVIRAHEQVFFGPDGAAPSDDELVGLAHRMGSTIMAYSFSLEKDEDEDEDEDDVDEDASMKDANDGDNSSNSSGDNDGWVEDKEGQLPLGMVPMADLLNADAVFNAHIHHGTEALTATAMRPIRAGDEILNYYGPLSNGELLRRYGYTTAAHAHFDAVDVPWALVQTALAKRLGLDEHTATAISRRLAGYSDGSGDEEDDEDDWEDPIMLDRAFDVDEATGELHRPADGRVLAELPSAFRQQSRAFVSQARRHQKDKSANTKTASSDKALVLAALAEALTARLAQYATTLSADEAALAALDSQRNSIDTAQRRIGAALRVRIGEKQLLQEAVALASTAAEAAAVKHQTKRDKSKKRGDGDDNDAGHPSGKRQKTRK